MTLNLLNNSHSRFYSFDQLFWREFIASPYYYGKRCRYALASGACLNWMQHAYAVYHRWRVLRQIKQPSRLELQQAADRARSQRLRALGLCIDCEAAKHDVTEDRCIICDHARRMDHAS